MERQRKRVSPWNTKLMETDRLSKGWTYSALAIEAGVSVQTVSRFLGGQFQSPKAAKKIAIALGYPVARYVRGAEVAA